MIVFQTCYAQHVQNDDFSTWVEKFKILALQEGISSTLLEKAFNNLKPSAVILAQDKKQSEFSIGFWDYFNQGVNANRINIGRDRFKSMQSQLAIISTHYNLQPRFLIALWGLESDFGQVKGDHNLIQSLATLSFNVRRSSFFQRELIKLLHIIDEGHLLLKDAKGSWAGAFGHTQLMPSTFCNYALDGDKDGKIDLIDSEIDALASAANYLKSLGWDNSKTWGREVILPDNFDYALATLYLDKPLIYWSSLGIKTVDGESLPIATSINASLVLPVGADGPAFLVYPNFYCIMRWNNSLFFALNVGLLSDAIANISLLTSQKPSGYKPLKTNNIRHYQTQLNHLGFDVGKADGIIGKTTRSVLQRFQIQHGLIADGYLGITTRHKIDDLTKNIP